MGKLVLLFFFLSFSLFAVSPKNIFQNDQALLDSISLASPTKDIEKVFNPKFLKYLESTKFKDKELFPSFSEIQDKINFWFEVYTEYDSNNRLIHDKENLNIVYEVVDFSSLSLSNINKNTVYSLQNQSLKSRIGLYKSAFRNLARGHNKGDFEELILSILDKNNIKIPSSKSSRKKFFSTLENNLRAQTGQKDKIQSGLDNFVKYENIMNSYIEQFEVPDELLFIPFLESSFNIYAKSKFGATGAWQFMRNIGKHFMVVDRYTDHRRSLLISTLSALQLLKQNNKILKSWPLAISAYNNGTGLLLKGIRKLKKKGVASPNLIQVIDSHNHPNFGFASKNFYSEFVALIYALKNRDQFYTKPKKLSNDKYEFYLTKCSLNIKSVLNALQKSDSNIKAMNLHFNLRRKSIFPKASVIVSATELTTRRYFKVPKKYYTYRYVKNWDRLVKNQSCSTK